MPRCSCDDSVSADGEWGLSAPPGHWVLISCWCQQRIKRLSAGESDIDGAAVDFARFRGKVVYGVNVASQ